MVEGEVTDEKQKRRREKESRRKLKGNRLLSTVSVHETPTGCLSPQLGIGLIIQHLMD